MKSIIRLPLLLLAAITILFLAGCVPGPIPMISTDQGLVIGQTYHLTSGQTLDHDLTVIGANATIDQNSTINGSLAVIGGTVTVDGTVNGDLSVIGSDVSLGDHAVVQGSVDTVSGTLHRAEGAVVQGNRVPNHRPAPPVPPVTTLHTPVMQVGVDPITAPLVAMFQALALAALAVVVNLFAPVQMERAGRTAVTVPAASGGVGCLTILVLIVMAVTIILIPVSFLGVLAAIIAALFGWLAIGLLIGRQIGILLKQNWTEPVNAGVGTLAITLLVGLLNIIPCLGGMVFTLATLVALGAAVLTRFGTQVYPSPYAMAPVPQPGPYTPPPAPAPVREEYPAAEPESPRAYPPESDQPAENPPSGPDNNSAI